MKPQRSLMSLIGFCLLTAVGAALAFAVIVAGGSVALAGHQYSEEPQGNSPIAQNPAPLRPSPQASTTFNGMITDSYCGARHLRGSHQSPAECARACVRRGATYILVSGDQRYQLTGAEDTLSRLAGQRANVTGTRQEGTIVVTSATPVLLP